MGKLGDGISIQIPKHFLRDASEPVLTKYGVAIEDWLKGGSFGAVPLVLAMTMLQQAITVLRDPYTQFLKEFFKLQRERGFVVISLTHCQGFSDYCNGDTGLKAGRTKKLLENYESIKALLEKHCTENGRYFSIVQRDITAQCCSVYDACTLIWLSLTGIRVSELVSICCDDYETNPDGTWTFKSELIKTNQGFAEARELSGLTLEAAETMVALSYITKRNREDGQRLALFGKYFFASDTNRDNNIPQNKCRGNNVATVRSLIRTQFESTLKAHPELQGECEKVHPHMFRHTWAEFALRRFDGNVFEAIRRHFLHSYGSYFTTHYTFNKLKEEVKDSLERRYLNEIITRIATESAEAFKDPNFKRDMTGKVVNYVSRAMNLHVIEISEINDFIDAITDEFESIVAHEYGYCMVRKDMRHLAKCYDRKTQMPLLENGCFALCTDCPNFAVSAKDNKEFIIRTAISHQNMIEAQEKLWGKNLKSKAVDASRKVIKQADAILDEMEA
ncbi:MAG: hypothetical protein CL582_07355 [Alteromonadaceae bacterium]|nr:hypothetical protein [Alteromonadaceae bacterium]|tara:strand:- start:8644 stop:10155 length:1512 start_codon:yes stop_codon:yes gene_type:complete